MNDDELHNQLQHALRREEPPAGFAQRVLANTAQKEATSSQQAKSKPRRFSFVRLRALGGYSFLVRWAATAAISAALIAGGIYYRTLQREKAQQEKAQRARAEGEAAKQRLMLALRIAGSKLQFAREKVQQINNDGADSQQEKE